MENIEFKIYALQRANWINNRISLLDEQLKYFYEQSLLRQLTTDELKRETAIRKEKAELEKERKALFAEQEKTEKEDNKENVKNNSNGAKIFLGIGAFALAAALLIDACSIKKANEKEDNAAKTPPSISSTIVPGVSATPAVTIPEGMHAFTDPTDDNQVELRAKDIINKYFKEIRDKIDNADAPTIITTKKVSDIIRFSNGIAPKYYEELTGSEKYDMGNVADYYAQLRTEIFSNYPGDFSDFDKMFHSFHSLQFPDGSEEAVFMKAYDDIYNEIADARNAKNIDLAREKIKVLSTMLYEDYVICGEKVNTEYSPKVQRGNPYNMLPSYRYAVLHSAISRWSSYVTELSGRKNDPICVPLCKDNETGEYKLVNVDEVYVAIVDSKGKNITLSYYQDYYGESNDVQYIEYEFYLDVIDELKKQEKNQQSKLILRK